MSTEAPTREAIDAAHERQRLAAADTRPDGAADDPVGGDPQDGLFDEVIADAELEAALDARAKAKDAKKRATRTFNERHDVVKGKLDALDLEDDTVVRCGRHRIKVTRTPPRSVAFETDGGRRMTISLLPEANDG